MSKYGEPWCVIDVNGVRAIFTKARRLLDSVFVASFNIDQGRQSPYAETNAKRIVQCVNACAGLDMRDVPEGAVRELVEATITTLNNNAQEVDWMRLDAALAPFVKGD